MRGKESTKSGFDLISLLHAAAAGAAVGGLTGSAKKKSISKKFSLGQNQLGARKICIYGNLPGLDWIGGRRRVAKNSGKCNSSDRDSAVCRWIGG